MQRRLRALANPDVGTFRIGSWSANAQPLTVYEDPKLPDDEAKAALKGKHACNCNRTDCQKPYAFFLNNGTNKYYCLECTLDIGCFALKTRRDAMELYDEFDENMATYEAHLETIDTRVASFLKMGAQRGKRQYADAREVFRHNQAVNG